ncbi:hypothetical protein JHK87_031999 [Glycine soja]|nr:hypothetical protein JHK87_031999 [Glycine soja]
MAKKFVVGFDYAAWAADKTFQVGDVLEHSVFKVNGTAFQSCTTPPASEALSNGNDRIQKSVVGHCNAGQKLVITVQPQTLPPTLPPSPTPAPSPRQHRPHFSRWVPIIFH